MEAKKKEHLKLEKQSGLYFAIGMALILALVYTALEWKTFDEKAIFCPVNIPDELAMDLPPITKQELPPPPPSIEMLTVIEISSNDTKITESVIPTITHCPIETSSLNRIDFVEPQIEDEIPFAVIQEVPVFPGCEKSDDKRACFQEKMLKHVRENFKYPENAIDMGLQGKVYLQFTVQKDGTIGGLKMRGQHQILESEAARIISKLPKMKPGKQRNQAVKVPFSIPITFQLQ